MLASGTLLNDRYEVIAPLGSGGMGEVYRARDRRLSRDVAIKTLPDSVQSNPKLLSRFEREAKTLAALSHPNILSIHDFATDQGISYSVTELLKGETLRTRLHRSPLSQKEELEIAIAVSEGLSAAHDAGIIHRDLKPENIFITSDNHVKILDFGLARHESKVAEQDVSSAPTATRQTAPNVVMGTIPYMSPEQVRGNPLDTRTDIFSFGCVLYEMISGHSPFVRETSAETMTAILKENPPALSNEVPLELQRVTSHCLEKKPENRFQSARDMTFALKSIAIDSKPTANMPVQKSRTSLRSLAIAFVILILAVSGWFLKERFQTPKLREKSVAVLPFRNLSENKEDEYFSDGMTEDVITQLSKIADLKVISRTSVMPYKNTNKGLRQIAQELGVAVVLEGSVRRSKDRIRIVSQLIDASSDEHIWADTFDRDLKDIFEIQSDVAQQIAVALKAKLSPSEKQRIEKQPTQNLAAYDYYLKGRESINRINKEANQKAIELFQNAIQLDPNFALAYAGLADAYSLQILYDTPDSILDTSIAISNKAISLDPNLADGYVALGYAYHFKGWHRKALEAERKAIELNPNNARAAGVLGKILWLVGRLDESLYWVKKYHQLDPTSKVAYRYVGDVYRLLTDFPEAKKWYKNCLALDPMYGECNSLLMYTYELEGNKQEIETHKQTLLSFNPKPALVLQSLRNAELYLGNYQKAAEYSNSLPQEVLDYKDGYVFWKTGNPARAEKVFDAAMKYLQGRINNGSEDRYDFIPIAVIETVRGNKTEAYKWLHRAIDAGFTEYRWLVVEPSLENLRGDAEFQQIIELLKTRVDEMRKRALSS